MGKTGNVIFLFLCFVWIKKKSLEYAIWLWKTWLSPVENCLIQVRSSVTCFRYGIGA